MKNAVSISEIQAIAARYRAEIAEAVKYVGANPELGLKEEKAAELQCRILQKYGFAVTSGVGSLPTAFRGDFHAATDDSIGKAAILTEYDALAAPLGHGCGHQLIMGSGLLALLTAAELMKKYSIAGGLCAMGCPGEEQFGGKVYMLEGGVFDDINVALMAHPFFRNGVTKRFLAVDRFEVKFFGHSAHASTAPEQGINALDAMTLFMSGINAWRQQLPESARVHGVITNGGGAANVIPDYTSAFFYVRSEEQSQQAIMKKRFTDIVNGAALMTGCRCEIVPQYAGYGAGKSYPVLNSAAEKLMTDMQMPVTSNIREPFSTDFANVCDKIPGVHIFFDITSSQPVPLHSTEFRDIAASPAALVEMEKAAVIMAKLALDYFTDKNLQQAVNSR